MHLKTSTMVAAGVLALAGTPLALHLIGGSSKSGPTNWVKSLHGQIRPGGHAQPATSHASSAPAAATDQKPAEPAQKEKPAPAALANISGNWTVTIESSGGSMSCKMVLEQDGKQLTGTFSNPHGDDTFPLTGEFADGAMTLSVAGKSEHGEMRLGLKGTISKDDGTLTGVMTSSMGESKFRAIRTK